MEQVFLGRTGIRVSQLALGTMTFGGEADRSTSAAIYRHAREAGITHFDTANIYQGGVSEEILGELIKPERDELVIATKAYFPTGAKGPNDRGNSRRHLIQSLESSLKRLRTDRVELFYLHRFDDETALEESLRAVEYLVQSGKVLYPAVSNFAAWQVAKALGIQTLHDWSPFAALQPMYNLLKRQAEVELLPMAESEGLGVFPYSPLAAGILSGKYGQAGDGQGRLAEMAMYKERYRDTAGFDTASRFTQLAREHGYDPVALAVAWVLSHSAVTAPLLGARSVTQLAPALSAPQISMTSELRGLISGLSASPAPATDRSEEGTVPLGTR